MVGQILHRLPPPPPPPAPTPEFVQKCALTTRGMGFSCLRFWGNPNAPIPEAAYHDNHNTGIEPSPKCNVEPGQGDSLTSDPSFSR